MSALKIVLVDYGAGNLPSVERALRRLGAQPARACEPAALAGADAIVLPGVGHFGALMRRLSEQGFPGPLREAMDAGVSFLGICLGLQALYASSDEDASLAGLAVFPGAVRKLPETSKLPHMGWNQLRPLRPSVLLEGIPADAYFYFAHSYAALDSGESAAALCEHGVPFVALAESGNVLGVQFHPEKSGGAGAQVLHNFLAFAAKRGKS